MNLKKSTKREKTILVGAYEKSNDGEKILKKYPDESTRIVGETENIKADQLLENKQNKKKRNWRVTQPPVLLCYGR